MAGAGGFGQQGKFIDDRAALIDSSIINGSRSSELNALFPRRQTLREQRQGPSFWQLGAMNPHALELFSCCS
jgi:hypothetical protein